jgi:hypothetical protein
MDEFATGTDATLVIPHVYNDSNLTVTNLQFQVLNAQGVELVPVTDAPAFASDTTSTTLVINQAFNTTDIKVDIRQVNLFFITDAGTYKQTVYYKILSDQTKLTPMVDSFMTFAESILIRTQISQAMYYFDPMDDAMKVVALSNAFALIMKNKFKDPKYNTIDPDFYVTDYYNQDFGPGVYGAGFGGRAWTAPKPLDISAYTVDQFNALPANMVLSLKKAQVVLANSLVENSPVREKIRQGIISETIGESSMFFKQSGNSFAGVGGKFPGISDDAYEYLKDYLFKNATSSQSFRIGRS